MQPLPWWRSVMGALDAGNVLVLLLTPRQDAKTTFLLALAVATLLTKRDAYLVFVAPSVDQAEAILKRKLHRPLTRLLNQLGLSKAVKVSGSVVECGLTGSTLEIVAATEFSSPGRSVTLLLIDEGKGIPDAVFEAVAPSVIGASGQIVVASTAGRPTGWLYELVQHPGEIERLFGWWNPAARDRELRSEFMGDGSELFPAGLIVAAVDETLGEIAASDAEAFVAYDLSRTHDLTSRTAVLRLPARRPEAKDHLSLGSIRVWDPAASPTGEVDFASVRADLAELPARFSRLRKVVIDEGAEAGSLLPFARSHAALTLITEGFRASVDSNMKAWGALAGRLHGQTISLPGHRRLLEELRSLRMESMAYGAKWRVTDARRRFHRDVSASLAMAVYAAELMPVRTGPLCWVAGEFLATQTAEEIQREEDQRAAEAQAASAAFIRERLRQRGVFFPGD